MQGQISFGTLNYVILFVYLSAMFYIGIRLAGKQESTGDLFVARRKMPWWPVAMSMFASLTSAGTYIGLPGTVFKENASQVIVGFVSMALAPVLILLFYPFYRKLQVTTSYEYAGLRYGKGARYATSTLFLLARIGWLGVVIYAPAMILSVTCGLNLYLSIIMIGMLSVAYTTIGGLAAVIWTDAAQFIIMVGAAIWVAITLGIQVPGGPAGILALAAETDHLGAFSWSFDPLKMTALGVMISYFFILMHDYGVDQMTVQRLISAKNSKSVAKVIIFNSFTDIIIMALLIFIGLGLFAYHTRFPGRIPAGIEGDKVFPFYIMHMLPMGVSGLVVTGVFAAAMSSVSSGINSVATVLVSDLIKPLRKTLRDDGHDLILARWLTFLIGLVCTGMAFYAANIGQLLKASQSILGLFTGPVLSLFLLGMLTTRAHFKGWLVGTIVSVGAMIYIQRYTELHWLYYFPVAFLISLTIGYVMSWLIPGPAGKPEMTIWSRHLLPDQEMQAEEAVAVGQESSV